MIPRGRCRTSAQDRAALKEQAHISSLDGLHLLAVGRAFIGTGGERARVRCRLLLGSSGVGRLVLGFSRAHALGAPAGGASREINTLEPKRNVTGIWSELVKKLRADPVSPAKLANTESIGIVGDCRLLAASNFRTGHTSILRMHIDALEHHAECRFKEDGSCFETPYFCFEIARTAISKCQLLFRNKAASFRNKKLFKAIAQVEFVQDPEA